MQTTFKIMLAIFVFKICYVLIEFGFNSHLLDVLGQGASIDTIHSLELYGRVISSIGLFLVVWRMLLHHSLKLSLSVGFVFGCALFVGWKLLINLIVYSSTPDQRYAASYLQFLPAAIASGQDIDGFHVTQPPDPNTKTLAALFGALAWGSPTLRAAIQRRASDLVRNQKIEEMTKGPSPWEVYVQKRNDKDNNIQDI